MTAAQDEGERRRTVEQGAERFMAKWIDAEKARAGLRHAVVCPNVTGRTNERTVQSKRARSGSLAIVVNWPLYSTFPYALGLRGEHCHLYVTFCFTAAYLS